MFQRNIVALLSVYSNLYNYANTKQYSKIIRLKIQINYQNDKKNSLPNSIISKF